MIAGTPAASPHAADQTTPAGQSSQTARDPMESSGPLPGSAWTEEDDKEAICITSDFSTTCSGEVKKVTPATVATVATGPSHDKVQNNMPARRSPGVRSPIPALSPTTVEPKVATAPTPQAQALAQVQAQAEREAETVRYLQGELRKILDEMVMLQWVYQRVSQYYGRVQLALNVALAVVAALTAATHQALSVAGLQKFQSAFVVCISGLQAVLISAIGYCDPASTKSECLTVSKSYGTIGTRLKFVVARPNLSAEQLQEAMMDVQRGAEQLIQQTSIQTPGWALRAWAARNK